MSPESNTEDEVSLKELLQIFWRGRVLMCIITLASTAMAVAAVFLVTKKYQAQTIVSPVADESNSSRLSSLVSQVGGFAALSGLTGLPSASTTQKMEIVAVLQSEAITERYIKDNDLLPILYKRLWDAANHRWKVSDPKDTPTLWKANVLFKKKVRFIASDNKSGLVTLAIAWDDPLLAEKWANGLVRLTNDYLRDKVIAESERNIGYLGQEAAKTDVVGVKEAIYSVMQNEIKKMMLARGSAEYALKVIDPAVAPERPSTPQPVMWTAIGLFGGFLLSLLVVFTRHSWRQQ